MDPHSEAASTQKPMMMIEHQKAEDMSESERHAEMITEMKAEMSQSVLDHVVMHDMITQAPVELVVVLCQIFLRYLLIVMADQWQDADYGAVIDVATNEEVHAIIGPECTSSSSGNPGVQIHMEKRENVVKTLVSKAVDAIGHHNSSMWSSALLRFQLYVGRKTLTSFALVP